MLTAKQIAALITAELPDDGPRRAMIDGIESAAEKIVAAMPDYNAIMTAGAALDNEVTSTLMDMLAATVLATLIKEEGGGRANITYSPETMANMTRHFDMIVENEGLLRTVRIAMKDGMKDSFFGEEPEHGPSVMTDMDQPTEGAKPQAEEHDYDRPVWAVSYFDEGGERQLAKMLDRKDAERHIPLYRRVQGPEAPDPVIQNRFCLHVECPTTGCNKKTEVASED